MRLHYPDSVVGQYTITANVSTVDILVHLVSVDWLLDVHLTTKVFTIQEC